jgi:hypothetical protein
VIGPLDRIWHARGQGFRSLSFPPQHRRARTVPLAAFGDGSTGMARAVSDGGSMAPARQSPVERPGAERHRRSYSPTRPLAAAPAFLGRSRSIKSVAVAQAISQGGRPCWGPTPSIRRHLSGIAQQQLGDASRWPEIFLLNPSIRHPTGLPRPGPDLPDNTPTQPPRLYSVRRGDTLSGIAQRERGAASRWPESLERNREVISNPDRIFPTRSSSSRPRCLPTEVVDLS